MADTQHITLQIVSHRVALNIVPEQEPLYRNAAHKINELYQKYQKVYPNMPVEQLWSYVALALAVNLQSDARDKNIGPIIDKVRELNQLIEETLNKE